MRALSVLPLQKDSLELIEVAEPDPAWGEVLVDGIAVGVCGTDHELAEGLYGWAPEGSQRLVIGHESLGRVRAAPPDSGLAAGDLVVGVVRTPDPEPCGACGHGEWDMCRNGRYAEHGIKQLHGFAADRWRVPVSHAVRIDPDLGLAGVLLEPTTIVAKAWEQVDRVGGRAWFDPKRVLVTGAGAIGLLAALLGAQRGLDVHVYDRPTDGPKPAIVRALGATFHDGSLTSVIADVGPDIIIEATGAPSVIKAVLGAQKPYTVTVLTGLSTPGDMQELDLGTIDRNVVLGNIAVVGSVNANLRHYQVGAAALAAADRTWLDSLISRRVPLTDYTAAFTRRPEDIKVVIEMESS